MLLRGVLMLLALILSGVGFNHAKAQEGAFTGPRHALVIGVGAYSNVAPLPSPVRDAEDVAKQLRLLNFKVTQAINPNRDQLNDVLLNFNKTLPDGALAFVYFSGHGVEVGGKNLLLPADFPHPNKFIGLDENTAPYHMAKKAVVLDDLLEQLTNAKPKNLIVVLDACRNNPLQPDDGKGTTKKALGGQAGLAAISPPARAYVMYAAGSRQKAVDRLSSSDTARNSLFTRHLLAEIAVPGQSLDRAFKNAAAKVEREAREKAGGHRQRPAIYTDVYEDIVLLSKKRDVEDVINGDLQRKRGDSWGEHLENITDGPIITDSEGWRDDISYQYYFDTIKFNQYPRKIDCAIYQGKLYFKGEFASSRGAWWSHSGRKKDQFDELDKKYTENGFQKIYEQTCVLNGVKYYNGTWVR